MYVSLGEHSTLTARSCSLLKLTFFLNLPPSRFPVHQKPCSCYRCCRCCCLVPLRVKSCDRSSLASLFIVLVNSGISYIACTRVTRSPMITDFHTLHHWYLRPLDRAYSKGHHLFGHGDFRVVTVVLITVVEVTTVYLQTVLLSRRDHRRSGV